MSSFRFPLKEDKPPTDRLDRLVWFLVIVSAILIVKDCYSKTHRPVCECRDAGRSEGLYGPSESPADTEGVP